MATIKKHGKIELSKSEIKFLKDNFQTMTNQELANHLGLKLTKTRMVLYKLGLKRMKLEYWTDDQVDFLIKNYQTIGDVELAEIFNKKWHKEKGWTLKHIEKKRMYLKLKRTPEELENIFQRNLQSGRFKVCNQKRWEKTGSNPVGTIVFWKVRNYPEKIPFIKTKLGYVHYHRWLYEQKHGKLCRENLVVPKLNAPKTGILTIDDLEVIDYKEHQRRNVERRMAYPEEMRKAIRLHNKILKTIKEKTNGK